MESPEKCIRDSLTARAFLLKMQDESPKMTAALLDHDLGLAASLANASDSQENVFDGEIKLAAAI